MRRNHSSLILAVVIYLTLLIAGVTQADTPSPVAIPEGNVAGHVWFDANCDGWKNGGEGDVPNTGIVQLVNTGADRVLTPGDRAQTFYTDSKGNWLMTRVPVDWIDDRPTVWAVAVGKGSAAALGYKPSPAGGDSILRGPEFGYASPTFQIQDGVTLQLGEIGVCPLPKALLPAIQK